MIAVERWLLKKESKDRPNYAAGKTAGLLEHDLLANIRANVVEYSAAKLYGVTWTFPWYPNEQHPRRKDHPDIHTNVEVRAVRTRTEIPVWQKDVDKKAIICGGKVLDDTYFSEVEIYGHIPARDAVRQEWFDTQSNCWRVPINELKLI